MDKEKLIEKYCFNCETGLCFCTCSLWDCPIVKKDLQYEKIKEREVKPNGNR